MRCITYAHYGILGGASIFMQSIPYPYRQPFYDLLLGSLCLSHLLTDDANQHPRQTSRFSSLFKRKCIFDNRCLSTFFRIFGRKSYKLISLTRSNLYGRSRNTHIHTRSIDLTIIAYFYWYIFDHIFSQWQLQNLNKNYA